MAEAQEKVQDNPNQEETEELERLLEASQETGEGGEGQQGDGEKATENQEGIGKSRKKLFILIGGGVVLLALLAGGAYYFLMSKAPTVEHETFVPPENIEPTEKSFAKVHVYAMQPFFLPLKISQKETGSFIAVTPNLVLSNNTLDKEIKKSLPAIRKEIYTVLSRKKPHDYLAGKVKIEEQVKKEILTTVNPILLAGTGTVTDVVFTQFVVK